MENRGHQRATVTVEKDGKRFRVPSHLLPAFEKRGARKVSDVPPREPKEAKRADEPKKAGRKSVRELITTGPVAVNEDGYVDSKE